MSASTNPPVQRLPYILIFIVNPSLASSFKALTESLSSQLTSTIVLPIFSSIALFAYGASSFGSIVVGFESVDEYVVNEGVVGVSCSVVTLLLEQEEIIKIRMIKRNSNGVFLILILIINLFAHLSNSAIL